MHSLIQGGITQHEEQSRNCKDPRDAHVVWRSAATESLQGCCRDTPCSSTCIISLPSIRYRRQEELDAGNCVIAGKLPLLLLVAAAAKPVDKEVPCALLQHLHHVLHQHTAGWSTDSDDREALVSVDCDKEAGDPHNLVFSKISSQPVYTACLHMKRRLQLLSLTSHGSTRAL